MTQPLEFKSEKGASRSSWVAVLFIVLLVGWMGSGVFLPSKDDDSDANIETEAELHLVTVAVRDSTAAPVAHVFTVEGQASPQKDTQIRTETGGSVSEVLVQKGTDIEAGQVLARIDPAQRNAELERARAEVTRTERDVQNAQQLLDRGVATRDRLVGAESAAAAARAGLAAAEEALGNLEITAPIGGRLEAFDLEAGEFVGAGTPVGRIVDLDPLTVQVQVPQQAISALEIGMKAEVRFITGQTRAGEISFLGTSANAQTRTFEAEVVVANPGGEIPAGLSASVRVPTGEEQAHFLSPAILSLNTRGTLGVKAVGEDNIVQFYPIEILRAQVDGVWVTGLPETATIITVGQAYVNEGEQVDPKPAELLDAAAAEAEALR